MSSWSFFGTRVVGVIFLVAALMKVAAPFAFHRHVARVDLLPHRLQRSFTSIAIGFEAAWGTALIVGLWPRVTLPTSALGLVLLTGISWWSVTSGKTDDCGCYGGFITPSIGQSVALNGLYVALILGGYAGLAEHAAPLWKILTVVTAGVSFGGVAEYALRSELRTGVALFTPSPLKIGQKWNEKWAGTSRERLDFPHLVSYMGPDCPYCKRWVRALNVVNESPDLPPVTVVLASPQEKIAAFAKETGLRLPVSTISQGTMQRLATAIPVTVLVEDGRISDVWLGAQMSESFARRFKAAFFPDVQAQDSSGG